MKILIALGLMVALAFSVQAQAPKVETHKQFVQQVYSSVALLYGQDDAGGMKMRCTATAYEQLVDQSGYRFVTAAHCVTGKTDKEQKAQKYYVTTDETDSKVFIPAVLVEAGDKTVGDDFAIFEVKTKILFAITPLGDNSGLAPGDRVINVASPLGLGKQYFEGYISNPKVDRPPMDAGEVQWTDVMLVEIGAAGGSSGSSVVSEDQHAIVGFIVGGTSSTIGVFVIPVNKFKAFETAVKAGKYHKSKKSDENASEEN